MSKICGGKRENNVVCRAIGIDLGTTYSCVGIWRNSQVEIIPNNFGNRTTASMVTFTQTECLVGDEAKNHALLNPTKNIYDVKRLIGRGFTDKIVQSDIKHWPFKVISCPTKENMPMIEVTDNKKHYFAEEISSMVLMKMKEIAEAYLGFEVKDAVITVPANFNDSQRQATKDAGIIAGLNVMQILNEPAAAAIAYGLEKEVVDSNVRRNVLVFDLGGGTLDVSLVAVCKDMFEVKAVSGDTHLGGGDFDNRLVSHFVEEFKLKRKKDISGNPRALGRLKDACERAKRVLSSTSEFSFQIDSFYDGLAFSSIISRSRFEELNIDLFEGCLKLVESCLKDATLDKGDVDEIVLVGGSTRIPKIQQLLQKFFNGKELCKSLNPDEAVACGAAIQASVLSGVRHNQLVMPVDVTPLTVGVKMENGEGSFAKENTFLARLEHCGISTAPTRGISRITNCFGMNVNCILSETAEEKHSGSTSHVNICKHSERFTQGEIDNMVKEAKKCMAGDTNQNKVMIAKANLESYVNRVLEILSDDYRGFRDEDKKKLNDAVEQTLQWLESKRGLISRSMFIIQLEELESICDPVIRLNNQINFEAWTTNW